MATHLSKAQASETRSNGGSGMTAQQKHLLDLPNDILLMVLARVPFSRHKAIDIQLACKKFDSLMHTRSLHLDINKKQFPVAGALSYSQEYGLMSLRATDLSNSHLSGNMRIFENTEVALEFQKEPRLRAVVERGFGLLGWLAHRAWCCEFDISDHFTIATVVDTFGFDLSALLALRCVLMAIWSAVDHTTKLNIFACVQNLLGLRKGFDADDDIQMFHAFENSVLQAVCSSDVSPWSFLDNEEHIITVTHLLYQTMGDDIGGYFPMLYEGCLPTPPSGQLWNPFANHLRYAACQSSGQGQWPRMGLKILANKQLFLEVKRGFMEGSMLEYVLQNLNLETIARNARNFNYTKRHA